MKLTAFLAALALAAAAPAAPEVAEAPPEVAQMCANFFDHLKLGRVSDAYAALLRGSKIADKMEKVADLQDRTALMLKDYGPILGWEIVKAEFVGKSLCRVTCLSRPDTMPVRWQITFYRPEAQWRVFNLQIDDAVMEFFK